MPPFIPQKRRRSTPPTGHPGPKSAKKPNLFDAADKPRTFTTLQDNKAFLDTLETSDGESSLSDADSEGFEDAISPPGPKKRKANHHDDDEDEIDWEDAINAKSTPSNTAVPVPSGDLELTLNKDARIRTLIDPHNAKKGPSKIARQIRNSTHCIHVQFLLFHNLVRSGWACDKEVQRILVCQLPPGVKSEVDRWRIASGMGPTPEVRMTQIHPKQRKKAKNQGRSERNERDWGTSAERQEKGCPNMSRGDPILRLLKVLAAYWKKRFTITAPGLRKQGYKPLPTLEEEITSWRNHEHDVAAHGERIRSIKDFRALAKSCEGSLDVGSQLFTALVRGLGLEARLVASLQPVGFGWNKNEEATAKHQKSRQEARNGTASSESSVSEDEGDGAAGLQKRPKHKAKAKPKGVSAEKRAIQNGIKHASPDLARSSIAENFAKGSDNESDDESVIDVTPSTPRKKPNANYDRDLSVPNYWTEVISPITNKVHPVDPLILTPAVVTSPEQLAQFEPRGVKADKAKQVFAYVIAYSPDGTAKEVTTRYLKRHMWPGRTKGMRFPVEKVPVYNARGKIKRYEEYDWFKTVISGYRRTHAMRSAVDDLEDSTDLKAVKPEKKEAKAGEETLQGYKSSAEFVLERHLRREEALRPDAKPVKTFATGKGENVKEEFVYRRRDVEICRTGESWHKEGRAVKAGEHPLKKVPVRAVTMNRKREVEEAERDGGEKLMQGMYARHQTNWIIPPPIENGVIPKNAYGNMDCYVPSMVPQGAVHIPLRSTVRICKRLDIDYAEAVTGFEFGKRMAVPIVTGVVVAEENEHVVIDEWEKDEEERRIKEEGKREKVALATWRKWLMGLRIIQRVKEEYGTCPEAEMREEMNPFTNQSKAKKARKIEGTVEEVPPREQYEHANEESGGGFLVEGVDDLEGGGFLPEGHEEEIPEQNCKLTIEEDIPSENNGLKQYSPPLVLAAQVGAQSIPRTGMPTRQEKEHRTPGRRVAKERKAQSSEVQRSKASAKQSKNAKTSTQSELLRRQSPTPIEYPLHEPTSAIPKRRSARRTTTSNRSHYFEHDSDESEESLASDESPEGDDDALEPLVKKRRGRPAGRTQVKLGRTSV